MGELGKWGELGESKSVNWVNGVILVCGSNSEEGVNWVTEVIGVNWVNGGNFGLWVKLGGWGECSECGWINWVNSMNGINWANGVKLVMR